MHRGREQIRNNNCLRQGKRDLDLRY
nr:unnamed protein product [Callosobruchus chinensis]